jgi:dTDP-4-amino-4,6-dideoxy-D-galactose acyltransferase
VSLIERLEWDSSFFGFPIGKVREGVGPDEIELAVREAGEQDLRCVYLLAKANDYALLDKAQRNGFLVRDVRIELEREVAGHRASQTGLRRGSTEDLARLSSIARESFRHTRFFADYGFPPDRSAELYVEWLRLGLEGNDGWEALVSDDTRGFVVCRVDRPSGIGSIALIGVASDAANKGLGSALMAGAGALFVGSSLQTATVVTQGNNVKAQRLYQSHGYRTSRTHLWLHRWMP